MNEAGLQKARCNSAALPLAAALACVTFILATDAWADPPASLADRLKAVQSGAADGQGSKLPPWKPAAAGISALPIPLIKGLTVVTAVNQGDGDYESIKTILEVGATAVTMGYSANRPKVKESPLFKRPGDLGQADPMREFPTKVACVRTIDTADLAKAVGYSEVFCQQPAEHFPGSTSIGASGELLSKLRAGQAVDFHFAQGNRWDELAQLGAQIQGEKPDAPLLTRYAGQMMNSCRLQRVGALDVAVPVLVNGQRVELPALHAACNLDEHTHADFFWLDQPANPITLAFAFDQWLLQTVKITVPQNPPAAAGPGAGPSPLERTLAERKPVQIYGIYFDFNSATIKPESESVLLEIAEVMRRNSDWRLAVNGYTDNIGGGPANTLLSQRRSAAVKEALVSRYHIDPLRLVTGGFGAASPIETNDTLEGRARNRRVELQRQ